MSGLFAINDFSITSLASMDFLLDPIYIKVPCNLHITFFFNIFATVCFPLDNTYKIRKLLFQLKENEFSALEMLGVIIDF